MRIKYQRTSTAAQLGKRFDTDTNKYDLVLFTKGFSVQLNSKREPMEKR